VIIDTHCHLDYFESEIQDQIITNALESGVEKMITISTKVSEFNKLIAITSKNPNIFCSIGNHPENVDEEQSLNINELYAVCKNNSKIVAIGETGLDYYHKQNNKQKQITEFEKHIELAKMLNLAIVVHARDAWDDIFNVIKSSKVSGNKFIMHCFTGSQKQVEVLNELDCYISISGIVTFKNAAELQRAVPLIKKDRIIVETDSPFLAPMPHRGKQNQPLFVKHVLQKVCELCEADISAQIHQNSLRAFGLAA